MNIDIISILYLPIVFYIGFLTSIEDWRTQKIRNKIILRGFWLGLFVYTTLMMWSFLIQPDSYLHLLIKEKFPESTFLLQAASISFFVKTVLNAFFALVIGFLMWKFRIMAAGDAKLFALFAWLLPTSFYWRSYLFVFPAFALLVNIFLAVLIFFIVRSYFFLMKNLNLVFNKERLNNFTTDFKEKVVNFANEKIKSRIWVFCVIVGVLLIIKNVAHYSETSYGGQFYLYQSYLMAFFIIFRKQIIDSLKQKKVKIVFFILLAFNIFLSLIQSPIALFNFLINVTIMMVIFMVTIDTILSLINFNLKHSSVRSIEIKTLKEGDIISDVVIEQLKNDKIIFHNYIGRIFPRGLDENEVMTIRNWGKNKNIDKIGVYEHFPFAFWMFVGVILTIIFKGSILNILLNTLWY